MSLVRRQLTAPKASGSTLVSALLASLVSAGCGAATVSSSDGTVTATVPGPTATATPEPTTPVDSSSPTAASTTVTTDAVTTSTQTSTVVASTSAPAAATDSSPARARRAQIARSALPGFNAQWRWDSAVRTSSPAAATSSLCLRSNLVAIGGVSQVATTFRASLSRVDVAYQVTAVFPDVQTATTAEKVLFRWLQQCRGHARSVLGFSRVGVSPERLLPTGVGTAHSRLVTAGPVAGAPDDTVFSGEGYVRDGDTITYLVLRSVGQDYNYEAGAEPVEVGLAVAATYLVRSR